MNPRRRQVGAALLALVAVIMVGGLWWLLSVMTPVNRAVLEREQNGKLLREAKQAVLGWVVQNAADQTDWNPGKLPCPESLASFTVPPGANEGVRQSSCAGAAAAIGRLPWKSLGIEKPVDASGEALWYVVGQGWKRDSSTTPEPALGLNSNSPGTLSVDGQTVVAAIIAPGPRLVATPIASQTAQGCSNRTQTRATLPPANSNDYLECQNIAAATLRASVVDNGTNPVFNDQVIVITAADVMNAIEPVIAKRIQSTVVPQLQSYVGTSWGGDATNPVFPFAVAYPSSGAFDPATSDFKGAAGQAQGLLPLNASTCSALTTGRCDADFVQWTGAATLNPAAHPSGYWTSSCASSATQLTCTINYSRNCFSVLFNAPCNITATAATLSAQATNVARALRAMDTTGVTNFGTPTMTATLAASGDGTATISGTVPAQSCNMTSWLWWLGLWSCSISSSLTITAPIGVFIDHPLANPATTDAWYWFTANNWHHVTYYAVSADDVPGGARNCPANNTCLGVTFDVGTSLASKRAILALAGRSVIGTAGSNRLFTDFLDTADNTNFGSTFEQKRIGRNIPGTLNGAFNDRFVSITP